MRIIAGRCRGRTIETPRGRRTRPMLDRVREAVFSILAPELTDARVLDLFAGSGSLGLEALSRGAASVRWVERDRSAAAVCARNAERLGFGDPSELVRGDALAPANWGAGPYGIVFLDPPYPFLRDPERRQGVLAALERLCAEWVAPGGVVVLHVPRGALLRRELGAELAVEERVYGSQSILLLRPPGGPA